MSTKWVQQSLLAVPIFVLTLLIGLLIPVVRPPAETEPISRAIKNASKLTETLNEERIRDWLFTLVRSGRTEVAVEFARRTSSDIRRIRAYVFVADVLREVGRAGGEDRILGEALRTANRIHRSDVRHSALSLLSARNGNVDEAFNGSRQISDKDIRSDAVSEICLILIQAGDFDAAARAARDAAFLWTRPRLLLRITEALLKAGQPERARAMAQEAFDLALRIDGGGDNDLLVSFAPTISRAGLSNELLDAFRMREKRDIYISDIAFEAVAVALAEAGDTDKALAVARGISGATNDGRARALAAISEVLLRAGRKDEAEQILTEALNTALKIQFPAHRSWALHKIAPMLVPAGRGDQALRAVRDLGPGDNEPLAFVAVTLIESGKWDEAQRAAAKAFASASNFEHTVIRSGLLIALVRTTLKAGRADDALQFIEVARQRLSKLQDSTHKSDACRLVAEAFAIVKKWDQAVSTAEMCGQEIDQLAAYTAIVREYSGAHGALQESAQNRESK